MERLGTLLLYILICTTSALLFLYLAWALLCLWGLVPPSPPPLCIGGAVVFGSLTGILACGLLTAAGREE